MTNDDIIQKLTFLGFVIKKIKDTQSIQRCATVQKPKKINGWFSIDKNVVNYGDWAGDIQNGYFFTNDKKIMTRYDHKLIKLMRERAHLQDLIERKAIVQNKFNNIPIFNNKKHAYLLKKHAYFRDDFKIIKDMLIIPVYNEHGTLHGYQCIAEDGNKKFGTGTIAKGGMYQLYPAKQSDFVILCEGYATASSIHLALNEYFDARAYSVICCFSAGNIDAVRDVINHKRVFAIKDNDEAGLKVKTNGFTVSDEIGEDANDVHVKYGLDILTERIVSKMKILNL
jgi:hypothetical protein